jgi:hypothetical protein
MRLVVDYFAYTARLGASARRMARRAARRQLLHLRRASGCHSSSRGSSCRSSSTTSPTPRIRVPRLVALLVAPLVVDYFASRRLVVNYFTYAARPGASARRAARRRLLRLAQARRRLHRLRRAFGCLGTSHGLSRCSSSTTSPTPRVRVPRHVTRLVTWLIVDYSVRRDFILRPHWLYFSHILRCEYLSLGNTGSTSSTPRGAATSPSNRIASTIHLD